jgi:predicted N-formylglutamate amidohydrolase
MKYTFLKNNLIFSSEHYTNLIPKEYKDIFHGKMDLLSTHRGWDLGSAILIEGLEKHFGPIVFKAEVSRLLVDLNRSIGHKNLYSEFTKTLPPSEKLALLDEYYFPYRDSFEKTLDEMKGTKNKPVIHIAIHSFTPIWNGEERNADIGILFDPAHPLEKDFCEQWKKSINNLFPKYKVRSNYPYHGKADSLPTAIRRVRKNSYLGIELEINQAFFSKNGRTLLDSKLTDCIVETLNHILV